MLIQIGIWCLRAERVFLCAGGLYNTSVRCPRAPIKQLFQVEGGPPSPPAGQPESGFQLLWRRMVCPKKYRRIQNITEYQNNLQRSYPGKGGPLWHGYNQIGDCNERTQKKCIFKIPKTDNKKKINKKIKILNTNKLKNIPWKLFGQNCHVLKKKTLRQISPDCSETNKTWIKHGFNYVIWAPELRNDPK